MNRTQFNKFLVPGLFSAAKEAYKPRSGEKEEWRQLVEAAGSVKTNSRRAYEESAYYAGLGNLVLKGEGEAITYDEMVQGPTKRWTHKTWGLGTRITEEAIDDIIYPDIPTEVSQMNMELGSSAKETITLYVFDLWNSGNATTTHTAGDGLAIFSNTHTLLRGGTWSNLLTPAADLSATTLQTSLDNFENQKDDTGKYVRNRAKWLCVNPSNAWKAKELLNSAYDPESNSNAVNTLKSRNLQLFESPFFTDTDAYYLISDPVHSNAGTIFFMRRKVTFAKDGDFETGDAKFKVTARWSFETNRPTNLYASIGA